METIIYDLKYPVKAALSIKMITKRYRINFTILKQGRQIRLAGQQVNLKKMGHDRGWNQFKQIHQFLHSKMYKSK